MKTIQCDEHGPCNYSIICEHLREQDGLGYFSIRADATGPAQAWCEACDQVLAQERGWTDRADLQAGWKLYCACCYERRLAIHILLSWVEGTSSEER